MPFAGSRKDLGSSYDGTDFISHSGKDYAEAPKPGDDEAIAQAKRLKYARWVRSAVEQRLRAGDSRLSPTEV